MENLKPLNYHESLEINGGVLHALATIGGVFSGLYAIGFVAGVGYGLYEKYLKDSAVLATNTITLSSSYRK